MLDIQSTKQYMCWNTGSSGVNHGAIAALSPPVVVMLIGIGSGGRRFIHGSVISKLISVDIVRAGAWATTAATTAVGGGGGGQLPAEDNQLEPWMVDPGYPLERTPEAPLPPRDQVPCPTLCTLTTTPVAHFKNESVTTESHP